MISRPAPSLELDPARAERLREESAYRANVRAHPLTRLIVFSLIALSVGLHNRFILREASTEAFVPAAVVFLAYATISWLVLFFFYEREPRLGILFLYADMALLIYAIYASGGDRSLLFFLPLVRVADQAHASFRRALAIGHGAVLGYAALIWWLWIGGRAIDLPAEAVKFGMLWAGVLYIAGVARTADKKRDRMSEAMRIARSSVALNERILACAAESIVGVGVDERIIFANERAARVLGRSVDDLVGSAAHDIAPHFAADGSSPCTGRQCEFVDAIRSAKECHGEHPGFVLADGRVIPVEYASAPLTDEGRLTGAVFSFRDISGQRAAQQALIAAKETAEEANLAKSGFLANMSHELRTPLNAVIGYSEMIIDELSDSDRSDLVPDVEKIRSSGQHLLGVINDLLEVAKIEAGRLEVTPEEFDIASLAQELEAGARKAFERRGNSLLVVCEDAGRANTDAVKVRRVIGSLLNNANKFTEHGDVTLRIRRGAGHAGDTIVFEVSDTGIGMSAEQAQGLFQAFRQGDMTATRRHGGTGLGLAIARGLTNLIGGTCSVVSQPQAGATFTVEIPANVSGGTPDVAPEALIGEMR